MNIPQNFPIFAIQQETSTIKNIPNNMKPYEINDTFPKLCTWKYQEQSVKEVLIKDSGYIKDLILLNENFALSEAAFGEAMAITKGFADKRDAETLADPAKAKKAPYDFDFNDEKIMELNKAKLTK